MLLWRRNVLLLALLASFATVNSDALAGDAVRRGRRVNLHVDSVVASDTHEGVDPQLPAPMGPRLQSLFSYTTFRLVSHQDKQTEVGQLLSFELPGGRILHVSPHEVQGNMIAMELVLFQGERPMMTTDLKLRNHGVLIVGGPRYEQGMLIISIGADTPMGPMNLAAPGGLKPGGSATTSAANQD